jgi:3-hydroxyacyl-CoA dehydrogenase
MGHGMAQVFATEGYDVLYFHAQGNAHRQGHGSLETSLATFSREGLNDKNKIPELMGRIKRPNPMRRRKRMQTLQLKRLLKTRTLR